MRLATPIPQMGDAGSAASGHAVGVRANVQTRPARSFWWDREPPAEADVLRAVIFDADSALTDSSRDIPRIGLVDSVMSLFCAGIWVGVVSTRRRERVETLVRHVVGDGLVETIVTVDDLAGITTGHARNAELYRLALWERAVDAQRFHPSKCSVEMRKQLSRGEPEKTLLLYVGRLSAEKDIGTLRKLLEAMPDARLAIIGDGPVRKELEKHFHGTPTYFAGYMRGEPLAQAYASADVFVMPSKTETLGLVLMEAMAAGCPVVACRAGGVPDAVEDGVTGFLYDPSDEDGLVQRVAWVIEHPEERAAVRGRARADVERHSWEGSTEQLRRYYAQAIEHPRPKVAAKGQMRWGGMTKKMVLASLRRLLP